MTDPRRRYSGNDVGYMADECEANIRLEREKRKLLAIQADSLRRSCAILKARIEELEGKLHVTEHALEVAKGRIAQLLQDRIGCFEENPR